VDAVLTLEPTSTIGSQKNVSKILVSSPMVRYIADPWCGGAGVITTKFLKERPKETKLFIEVMRKAIIKTQENPENRNYLVKYLQLPESVAKEIPLPLFISTENIDPKVIQAYQKFADIFYELNVTQARPDVSKLLLD
jgi:NitT/TauT family transport system substrate-binding protein